MIATTVVVCEAFVWAAPQQPLFSSGTLGIRVDVLVTDHGVPVGGLAAKDFELRDNGVLQSVDVVNPSDVKVNVVLALDTSASTTGQRLTDLVAASRSLLARLKPGDRAALTTFSHDVSLRVPLTADITQVNAVIDNIAPMGATALLDGIHVALMTSLAEAGRSLVVVCTDGKDTSSWLDAGEVLESAKRSNAVIYIVASRAARHWAAVKDLADATGGQMIEITSSAELGVAFQKILQDFRSRYVLSFTPTGVAANGLHRLDVRAKGGGFKVTARSTYLGLGR